MKDKSAKTRQRKEAGHGGTPSYSSEPPPPFMSESIALTGLEGEFVRADLEFDGVDHGGVSFEARVFLNNTDATADTLQDLAHGYAGSFNIFGHGGCLGDPGHCDIRGLPRLYDPRPANPLTPARKIVIATEAIRYMIKVKKKKTLIVKIVPVVTSGTTRCDYKNVLKLDQITLQIYK